MASLSYSHHLLSFASVPVSRDMSVLSRLKFEVVAIHLSQYMGRASVSNWL